MRSGTKMIKEIKGKPIWASVISVVLASMIAWGAWNTMATAGAVSTEKFDNHVTDQENDKDRMQERIVDKLDEIQQTILDLHKGDS